MPEVYDKKHMSFKKLLLAVVAITLIFVGIQYFRAVPESQPQVKDLAAPSVQPIYLPWPTYGQSALGARDYGVLETQNHQTPVPMASITKVITVMSVLKQKPLSVGYHGPNIRIGSSDVASYNSYYAKGGSITKVVAGEKINEYQALQSVLLPSSNNMADTLAIWAFGSMNNYLEFANHYIKELGATQTTLADASGWSSKSVSTAEDLVKIGLVAMRDTTISDIVKQQAANIPIAGVIRNVNWLLDTDGVVGIKTGNTDQAGGCYLFAANRNLNGQTIQVVGAILASPSLNRAIADARKLIIASGKGFNEVTVAKAGDIVGTYQTDWGSTANATVDTDISLLTWKNLSTDARISLEKISSGKSGTEVGRIIVSSGDKTAETRAVLGEELKKPPISWRLFH